jgi:hypothetical protein
LQQRQFGHYGQTDCFCFSATPGPEVPVNPTWEAEAGADGRRNAAISSSA